MDSFAGPFIVAAQYRPTGSVCFGKRQFQLGSQNLELRLLWIDRRKQWIGILVSLVVRSREIKLDGLSREIDLRFFFVNLLKVEGDIHGGRRLIEVVSVDRLN